MVGFRNIFRYGRLQALDGSVACSMLERRTCSPWLATLLAGALCLSVWQMIGCPGPPSPMILTSPVYTVLSFANASADTPYAMDQLKADDYSRLVNLHGFRFTMFSQACNESGVPPPLLLVLVHSAPDNVAKRRTIRQTWGEPRDAMKLVFMVGQVATREAQLKLDQENRIHEDLVQGSFMDAYRNMTYKHVMALKYAVYHCPQAKYILKTDDDIFVNMPTMMTFLNVELSPWGARRLLLCRPLYNSVAKRSFRSKWRVSYSEYSHRNYPPYCPGWAILYSPDVVFKLYAEAQRTQYFWIDDVLVTGILAERAQLIHTPVADFVLTPSAVETLVKSNGTKGSTGMFLYGPPDMVQDDIYALWAVVQDRLKQYRSLSP
ncbi:uncharacterized protein CBL_11499 [Carabus blaptoides fortunei]